MMESATIVWGFLYVLVVLNCFQCGYAELEVVNDFHLRRSNSDDYPTRQRHRNLQGVSAPSLSLRERFNISEPVLEQEDLMISLTFGVSSVIDLEQHVQYVIYDNQCKDRSDGESAVVINTQGVMDISLAAEDPIAEDFRQDIIMNIALQPEGIRDNPSIYSHPQDSGDATLSFCVRFMLYTEAFEVNYLETVVTLRVDLTDGFGLTEINTEAKEKTEGYAILECKVEASLCDCDLRPVNNYTAIYNQGSDFRVCVRPHPDTLASGLVLKSVHMFDYWREDDPSIHQVAVKNGKVAPNLLTEMDCSPDLCVIDTILRAGFYDTRRTVRGSGFALCQFGSIESATVLDWNNRKLLPSVPTSPGQEGNYARELQNIDLSPMQVEEDPDKVPLDTYWNLTYPKFEQDDLRFNLTWTLSDAIEDGQAQLNLYDKDCKEFGSPVDYETNNLLSLDLDKLQGGGNDKLFLYVIPLMAMTVVVHDLRLGLMETDGFPATSMHRHEKDLQACMGHRTHFFGLAAADGCHSQP